MSKHSPLPWHVPRYARWQIVPEDGLPGDVVIAETHTDPRKRPKAEMEANAEFIVRACNSHEELLAAVGDALEIITWMSGSDDFSETGQAHKGWVKAREKLTRMFATYKKAGGNMNGDNQ